MKISLYLIGKTNFDFVKQGFELYGQRIKHYIKFEVRELPDIKGVKNMSSDELKRKEGEIFLKKIPSDAFLVLLDENGKKFNSRSFATEIERFMLQSVKELTFVVGGAFGFSDEMYQRAQLKISLSEMTFSHQLIRLIFAEQLYRAFSIINNEPYHND
jgi:23S rRNA (pseudouridine1915-N3)-methyltransferase